jgi:hypothetical protein
VVHDDLYDATLRSVRVLSANESGGRHGVR